MNPVTLMKFVTALIPEIIDIIDHVVSGQNDAEKERQLGMNLIRKAKDEQAKREISGD